LQQHQSELQRMGLSSLSLFGSLARDQLTDSSDIDLLASYSDTLSLIDVVHAENYLRDLFERPVQLVNSPSLRPSIRDRITAESVRVF
jgi:predicted nucleotidyltransferase